MPPKRPGRRAGFTLLELLVVLAVRPVMIGLLLPSVQKVGEAAARVRFANYLKQIGLAAHHAHDTGGTLPPGLGYWSGDPAYGMFNYRLLPFRERYSLYEQSLHAGYYFVANTAVYQQPVRGFA